MSYSLVVEKKPTSFRLTTEALRLLAEISEKLGISQAAVLELAIRDVAKQNEIK